VIVVHATGGCEVYDTASRNGVRVNGSLVARTDLVPGDVLTLCFQAWRLECGDPHGISAAAADTSNSVQISPTEFDEPEAPPG
jgi:hypothetical protein